MMMEIGLISDTHVSAKRGKLNEKIFEIFKDVDFVDNYSNVNNDIEMILNSNIIKRF